MRRKVHPLQNIILASLPYDRLYNICFDYEEEDEALRGVIDCRWEVWRDRALGEFNTPYAFFDLPRYFSYPPLPTNDFSGKRAGIARYREVSTYYKLSSRSAASIRKKYSKHGKRYIIEGVYEPLAGIYKCLEINEPQGLEYFFPLLNHSGLEELKKKKLPASEAGILLCELLGREIRLSDKEKREIELYRMAQQNILPDGLNQNDLEVLVGHGNEIAYQRVLYILEELYQEDPNLIFDEGEIIFSILRSGRVDFLQGVLKYFFPFVSKDFVIERDIPILPFDPLRKSFPLVEIPLSREISEEDLSSSDLIFAISGGNIQIVDFFRSLNGIEIIPFKYKESIIAHSDEDRIPPENIFSILQRTESSVGSSYPFHSIFDTGNIDLFLFELQRSDIHDVLHPWIWETIIEKNKGNLPFIFTLLTYLQGKIPSEWLYESRFFYREQYPLTYKILKASRKGKLDQFTF